MVFHWKSAEDSKGGENTASEFVPISCFQHFSGAGSFFSSLSSLSPLKKKYFLIIVVQVSLNRASAIVKLTPEKLYSLLRNYLLLQRPSEIGLFLPLYVSIYLIFHFILFLDTLKSPFCRPSHSTHNISAGSLTWVVAPCRLSLMEKAQKSCQI